MKKFYVLFLIAVFAACCVGVVVNTADARTAAGTTVRSDYRFATPEETALYLRHLAPDARSREGRIYMAPPPCDTSNPKGMAAGAGQTFYSKDTGRVIAAMAPLSPDRPGKDKGAYPGLKPFPWDRVEAVIYWKTDFLGRVSNLYVVRPDNQGEYSNVGKLIPYFGFQGKEWSMQRTIDGLIDYFSDDVPNHEVTEGRQWLDPNYKHYPFVSADEATRLTGGGYDFPKSQGRASMTYSGDANYQTVSRQMEQDYRQTPRRPLRRLLRGR
jgi:hypothetical protein